MDDDFDVDGWVTSVLIGGGVSRQPGAADRPSSATDKPKPKIKFPKGQYMHVDLFRRAGLNVLESELSGEWQPPTKTPNQLVDEILWSIDARGLLDYDPAATPGIGDVLVVAIPPPKDLPFAVQSWALLRSGHVVNTFSTEDDALIAGRQLARDNHVKCFISDAGGIRAAE